MEITNNITMIVTAQYAKLVANGEIPQTTIPRTPTGDAAYEQHKKTLLETGWSVGEYVRQNVLRENTCLLQRSPFPYACEVGVDHYIYWMNSDYEPVEVVRDRISKEIGADRENIHIIKNQTQSVPEVAHYQVFVDSGADCLLAPCYGWDSARNYVDEWVNTLGTNLSVEITDEIEWPPVNGMNIRTFRVKTIV